MGGSLQITLDLPGNERKQRVRVIKKGHMIMSRSMRSRRRILMKRKGHVEGSRRPTNAVQRRVRILRKLIPISKSVGLDGLFRETVDYIMALQMRVQAMQVMVNLLSGPHD